MKIIVIWKPKFQSRIPIKTAPLKLFKFSSNFHNFPIGFSPHLSNLVLIEILIVSNYHQTHNSHLHY
jgi:hypothetical protein